MLPVYTKSSSTKVDLNSSRSLKVISIDTMGAQVMHKCKNTCTYQEITIDTYKKQSVNFKVKCFTYIITCKISTLLVIQILNK